MGVAGAAARRAEPPPFRARSRYATGMGTIGTRLYDDDTAADVRDEWRDRLAAGLAGEEATRELLAGWADSLDDEGVAAPFWLALADTQWRAGRLEARVKEEALAWFERDLDRWDLADRPRRRKVLDALRARLLSPPPRPRRVSNPVPPDDDTDLRAGQVLGWRLPSGRWCLLHVATIGDYLGRAPIVRVLDWTGDALPSTIPTSASRPSRIGGWGVYLRSAGPRDKPRPERFRVLELELPALPELRAGVVFTWKFLDTHLADFFDLR